VKTRLPRQLAQAALGALRQMEERMMKTAMMKRNLGLFAGCLLASSAYAAPVALNDAQMDSVVAGGNDTVSGFLCTVNIHYGGLETAADMANTGTVSFNEVNGTDINGDNVTYYTVAPHGAGDLTISSNATNTGTPTSGFSAPGQVGYTAIWASQ